MENIIPIMAGPSLLFRSKALLSRLDKAQPATPGIGNLLQLSLSNEHFHIIKHCDSTIPIYNQFNRKQYPSAPTTLHATNCCCSDSTCHNNLSTLFFALSCRPSSLYVPYEENPTISSAELLTASQGSFHHSLSTSFASEVSEYGTVLPRIIRRTPVAILTRMDPVYYTPPFSDIDLVTNTKGAHILATQLARKEFSSYTRNFAYPTGTSTDSHRYRFRPKTDLRSLDVKIYPNIMSVEDILINSPCAEPYYGMLLCVYCEEYLDVQDITTVTRHIIASHLDVLSSTFSCPSCLAPRCFNKNTFTEHFQQVHSPTLALLCILNDIAIGQRLQYGLALHVTIDFITSLRIDLPSPPPSDIIISNRFGGYGAVNPATLTSAIKKHQAEAMPPLWVATHADATSRHKRLATHRASDSHRTSPTGYQYSDAAKRKRHDPTMDFNDTRPGTSSWREAHRSPSPIPSRSRHRSISPAPTPGSSILYDSEDDRQGAARSSDEEI
jgi:hypothetical protein